MKRKDALRKNFSEKRMYYEKLADKYHILQYIVGFLTVAFAVCSILFGFRLMRGDSFRYLWKTLSANPVSLDAGYEDISYAVGSGVNFTFFKDDLAVVGDGKAMVYSLSGDLRFRHNANSTGATYAVSEKYIAVYTPGAKGLCVYNSFGCVWEKNFKMPIRSVAVSDGGKIAVCFKDTEYTRIEVFDADFRSQAVFSIPDVVPYDLDLSPNGDKLVLTSLATLSGSYHTALTVFDVSSEKIIAEEKIDGKKPVSTGFFEDGRFYAAVQGNIFFYQSNAKASAVAALSGEDYSVTAERDMLVVLQGTSKVFVYSKKGDLKNQFSLAEKVFTLKTDGRYYYTMSDEKMTVYHEDGEILVAEQIPSGVLDFFVLSDGSILICYVSETDRMIVSY